MANNSAAPVTPTPDTSNRSPTQLALARFWARSGNRYLVAAISLFIIFGIYAPFLASETAFIWQDDDGLQFPWFSELFNRRTFSYHHDFIFNIIMLTLPFSYSHGDGAAKN